MILVDSNVLIDLVQRDAQWAEWSKTQLFKAQLSSTLCINTVGYAELAPAFNDMGDLDSFLKRAKIETQELSRPAAYFAGLAFLKYRKRKGTKTGVLADFFIGAQAQTEGWKILTRDSGRYASYFPNVQLICP